MSTDLYLVIAKQVQGDTMWTISINSWWDLGIGYLQGIRYLALNLLLFSYLHLSAQNSQPHFRNYTTDDGLPSSEVYDILQDKEGYMWLATDNGVSRFDSYNFRNFTAADGLNNNVVFHLRQDAEDRIWMATMSGNLYYYEKDSIHTYAYNPLITDYKNQYLQIKNLYIDSLNNKWLTLEQWGILKISPTGESELFQNKDISRWLVKTVENYPLAVHKKPKNKEEQNTQWRKSNLVRKIHFEIEDAAHNYHLSVDNPYQVNGVQKVFALEEGKFLFCFRGSLYLIHHEKVEKTLIHSGLMHDICFLKNGGLLVSLLGENGLRYYKNMEALFEQDFQQYLKGMSISQVCEDKKGGIWVSSLENGVFYCPDWQVQIYDHRIGFSEDFVGSIAWKDEEHLWIGLRHGDVMELSIPQHRVSKFPPYFKKKIPINYDLHYDTVNKRLWSAIFSLAYLDEEKKEWQYYEISNELGVNIFQSSAKSFKIKNQSLWMSGAMGFASISLQDPSQYWQSYDVGYSQRTFVAFPDSQERLWIGNAFGLFEFKNDKAISPPIAHPAFQVRTEDIAEMPDSTLVIGTKGQGILFWKNQDIQQLTKKEGLTSNMIENIHIDEKQQIWVGTMNGLNKITPQKNGSFKIEQITTAHGLPSNEINQIKSRNGQVWVATTKGLVHLPNRPANTFAAAPIFSNILINNQVFESDDLVNLNHQQNNLSCQVLSINYKLNGSIKYRYRLNETATWNYTTNPVINFVNLPPAHYSLAVQAQNEDRFWSKSATLDFNILPPFWKQWWFWILISLMIGGLIFLWYKYRTQQLKKEHQLQQKAIELEKAALQAQMNPHFIFNCLNSIQYFILQNDPKNAITYLAKFAKLVRSVLRFSMSGTITLEEEIQAIENYLALEKLRFKERFDYEIKVAEQLDRIKVKIPPLLVQPFVENAIIHGMSNREVSGLIRISYTLENQLLLIQIEDNGPGFRQHQKASFTSKKHHSVGMTLTKQRLQLLENSKGQDDISMEEMTDKNGAIQGTLVTLKLNVIT